MVLHVVWLVLFSMQAEGGVTAEPEPASQRLTKSGSQGSCSNQMVACML